MPKFLVVLEAQIEVECDEIGYAEELAIDAYDETMLYASFIEEV